MKTVYGNTYPVKDRLRAMGGKWDATYKVWQVPDNRYDDAMALLRPPPKPKPEPKYKYNGIAFAGCGHTVDVRSFVALSPVNLAAAAEGICPACRDAAVAEAADREAETAARRAAELEKHVPGVTEGLKLYAACTCAIANAEYCDSLDDDDGSRDGLPCGYSSGVREADALDAYVADKPRVRLYLAAEAQSTGGHWSDPTGSAAAGRKAMEILTAGGTERDAEAALAQRREYMID